MKLLDLIRRLTDIADDMEASLGPGIEPEVIAAYQPAHPLTGTIDSVTALEDEPVLLDGAPVVWIVVGGHPEGVSPLAPGAVFEVEP